VIRNEEWRNGVLIRAEVIDLDAATLTIEEMGEVVTTRPLTDDEIAAHTPQPTAEERIAQLEAQLAALLAQLGGGG
jgi:hypothetical protein